MIKYLKSNILSKKYKSFGCLVFILSTQILQTKTQIYPYKTQKRIVK